MKQIAKNQKDERNLEIALIIITIGLACLMWKIAGFKLVVLNLFYLPVVLAGFFLGRYRAGMLASLSVIAASIVTALNLNDFAVYNTPIIIGLSVTLWAAVLGLTALLVGTLSDDRAQSLGELHEAHVGVVEVLSRYLQSANPKLKVRSQRIAELSQAVAREMELTSRECDDIRVAALLYDMENIEITAKVIRRAVGDLETQTSTAEHSFHGSELAHSLGSVLSGAFPLLLSQGEAEALGQQSASEEAPIGAKIIRAVRAYDRQTREVNLVQGLWSTPGLDAIDELRRDLEANHPEAILDALELVISSEKSSVLALAEVN
jgi:K+-sensing histidine kinase KdpD